MPGKKLNALPTDGEFDEIADEAGSMAALIAIEPTFRDQFDIRYNHHVSEAELDATAHSIRNNCQTFDGLVLSLTRKHRMSVLSAIVVWKAHARKIDGYLERAFDRQNILVANNTDSEQAENATIVRLLTSYGDAPEELNKSDISRCASAITGLEIFCHREDVAPSFETALQVFEIAQDQCMSDLIKVARERRGQPIPVEKGDDGRAASNLSTQSGEESSLDRDRPTINDVAALSNDPTTESQSMAAQARAVTAAAEAPETCPYVAPSFSCGAPPQAAVGGIYLSKIVAGSVSFYGPVTTADEVLALFEDLGR